MTRSHPPTLLRQIERCLRDECELPQGPTKTPLVVAVSGGPDSLALLHCLHRLSRELPLTVHAASIDHGLRPEAAAEVAAVGRFCEERGIRFQAVRVEVGGEGGLQAAARQARYQALHRAAETLGPDALIATAHHADDRAETVLLRLLRGVSLEGLGVLPARDGRLIRPMIRASRQDVLAHCARHELSAIQDPSNRDSRFLRVRVRQELLPLLEELSPGVRASLNALADEAGELESPLGLHREQRRQLRRALLDPSRAIDLPLAAGLRLWRPLR